MLTYHPAANLLPLMEGVPFESLCDDIRLNGQLDPIIIHNGQIVDGRNRFRACLSLNIVPRTEEWTGEESAIPQFVLSKNIQRRNLNASQRACVALKLEEYFAVDAKKRQRSGKKQDRGAQSVYLAGRCLYVSGRYVGMAKRLRRLDSALFNSVVGGEIKLTVASRKLKRPSRCVGCSVKVTDLRTGRSHTATFPGVSVDAMLERLPNPLPVTEDTTHA